MLLLRVLPVLVLLLRRLLLRRARQRRRGLVRLRSSRNGGWGGG